MIGDDGAPGDRHGGALAGKVAVVTGAARGQGRAEAELFAAEGATVVLTDVLDGIDAAAAIGERATFEHLDVTDGDAWNALAERVAVQHGRIDVLVNNAGVHVQAPIWETTAETMRRVFEINTLGAFHGIQAVRPAMVAAGGGSIVNVASIAGLRSVPVSSAYMTSKFALRGLTRSAAVELGPLGIRVNAICPGVIRTPMVAGVLDDREAEIADTLPLRHVGEAEDVAHLALYLASDASRFVTGADLVIDGGSLA